ncbi:hypothetical protein [Actinosynnema sp. NPDC023587]|uniref:hypothetical protein n=1 Tax=Actinosynnema sp. NPDC023587 TaxID=3154695 RepID=UPI0033E0D485
MTDAVMHIATGTATLAHTLRLTSGPRAFCGVRITGAARTAPLCPACATKAGWTHDKRH